MTERCEEKIVDKKQRKNRARVYAARVWPPEIAPLPWAVKMATVDLKAVREARHLSQVQISRALKVSNKLVSAMERGTAAIPDRHAGLYARILGVRVDQLPQMGKFAASASAPFNVHGMAPIVPRTTTEIMLVRMLRQVLGAVEPQKTAAFEPESESDANTRASMAYEPSLV